MQQFLAELKRRRVFRVAAAYVVIAFALLQAADIIFPALGLPPWTMTLVVVLAFLGFPAAVVLAWAFDITPEGVVRTDAQHAGPEVREAGVRPLHAGRIAVAGAVVLLAGAGLAFALSGREETAPERDRSIAVLPFGNLSAEAENAYFASGIHEEILTQLSKIADLKVISRSSVMQYAEAPRDLREIGERLDVATVLEGSVQRVGDRVRIHAQLIDARTDRQLWAERYDRDLSDIFAIQSEVALEIARALNATLSRRERERIERRPTENLAAYDLYLRGQELIVRGREQNETAIELFKQAIRLDPNFAAAYASLGSAYMQRTQTYGFPQEWVDSGVVMARKAIEIDPALAAGYRALGSNLRQLGRLRESHTVQLRTVGLDPNDGSAMVSLSVTAALLGRFDEAMRWAWRALPLVPTSPFPPVHLAFDHWTFGSDTDAEQWVRRAFELQPDFAWGHMFMVYLDLSRGNAPAALARARQRVETTPNDFVAVMVAGDAALFSGSYEEAASHFERLVRMVPDGRHMNFQHSFRSSLAFALLKTGQQERALRVFDQALEQAQREIERGNENPGLLFEIGMIHMARGEKTAGYEWLERAYDGGWRHSRVTVLYPMLESIRGEPRFQQLLARIESDLQAQRARLQREGAW